MKTQPLALQLAHLVAEAQRGYLDPLGRDYGRFVELVNRIAEDAAREAVQHLEQLRGSTALTPGERGILVAALVYLGDRCGVPQLAEVIGQIAAKFGVGEILAPRVANWIEVRDEVALWRKLRDAEADAEEKREGGGPC